MTTFQCFISGTNYRLNYLINQIKFEYSFKIVLNDLKFQLLTGFSQFSDFAQVAYESI